MEQPLLSISATTLRKLLVSGQELDVGALRVRTSLGASHQVSFGLDDGNGILLDRRGPSVAGQRDVAHDDLSHVHIMKLGGKKSQENG